MHIVTHTCPTCGTVVSANELRSEYSMPCPGLDCDERLDFEDIPADEREQFLAHYDQYWE